MEHEYLRRIYLAVERGIIDRRTASLCEVAHDDQCPVTRGKLCTCDPRISVEATDSRGRRATLYIDRDGFVQARIAKCGH